MADEVKNVVNAKCRRGSDKVTSGQSCNSMRVINLSPPGSSTVQFKCDKCGYCWTVNLGGTFTLP